jgi:hypothetical protein
MEEQTPAQPSRKSPLGWIAFIIVVLIFGAAGFTALQNNPGNNNRNSNNAPTPSIASGPPISPHTLVYGAWTGSGSEITALDLSNRTISSVATLPDTIKKVSILSPDTLIYINGTNLRDHGASLSIYSIKDKEETVSIPADNGFGIDDYILSPNKKFVAIWEVSFAQNSEILQGGRSRVYAVDLSNPTAKRLLYDETASADTPVNYPRAILDDGKVFTDKFIPNDPNSGMGWAYGMSVVDFNGSNKRTISSMSAGTYGTQPFLSPDGKYLAFAGYDGTLGDGSALRGGIRQALLTPNTVELLDTATLERRILENLPNSNTYSNVYWDNLGENLVITILSGPGGESGLFSYDIGSSSMELINLPEDSNDPYSFIGSLSPDIIIIGKTDNSRNSLANLGEEYAASLKSIYVKDNATDNLQELRLNATLAQHIAILPANYFPDVLGVAHAQGGNPADPNVTIIDFYSDKPSRENLQLKTFLMKPELAPVRERQQSNPPNPPINPPFREKTISCRDLATEQCLARGYQEGTRAFENCHDKAWDANRATKGTPEAVCNKSPLYVYGTPGQTISVTIQTSVYNDSPQYNGSYDIKVLENDGMSINGKVYEAINYDYRSNLKKMPLPAKGVVVSKSDVEKTLRSYAKNLGLNEKETNDLVANGKAKITSPYVFISFFDHATSQSILPLTFNPEPDNYLNVVFYFKLLNEKPNFSIAPPDFGEPLTRNGLTVVEVSEIVE